MAIADVIPFHNYGIREMVCIVQELNCKRFYRIEVAPGLFGPLVIRAWGRIGCRVRVMVDHFTSLVDAVEEANRLYRTKKRKGYSEVASIIEGKTPAHPSRISKVHLKRTAEGEPTLPGI